MNGQVANNKNNNSDRTIHMVTTTKPPHHDQDHETDDLLALEGGHAVLIGPYAKAFAGIALCWSLFQLWIASPLPFIFHFGLIDGVEARGLHLTFALLLGFLLYGFRPHIPLGKTQRRPSFLDLLLGLSGAFVASYLWWNHADIADRAGIMAQWSFAGWDIPIEAVLGWTGIVLLLEATRRIIGLPLVIMCLVFITYSLFGQSMPDLIAHKGVSVSRLAGNFWLGQEAIFGIPIDVSTRFIFLFVLFGALLDKAGAGQYFIDLAFGMVGRFRGGPAKASVLASGMTGMISGSSIANTVTTGTFTIPVMKKAGVPAVKAGAIEVAASVDGQIMPPIMGAAAFVIAEFIGISYFDVVKHAFLPALISYIALFYITDIEAQKLNLKPMKKSDLPSVKATFWRGAHFLLPILLLIHLLIVERMSTGSSVFWATLMLMGIIMVQEFLRQQDLGGLRKGFITVLEGLIAGARNMIAVAVAVASAGIIVGAVASTGLSNSLSAVVETLAGGNIYLLLGLIAILSLVLGLGLPTTANYLVVASLMAPVIIEVGAANGLELPLIAVHLFVFYFGLMADVTPPVGLAAYAAAGISGADPIKTGIQAFFYSIRTAILPFIFIFNLNILMIGIDSWAHAALVITVSTLALLCFVALTQRWMFTKLNWFEMAALAVVMVALFRPGFFMDQISPRWQDMPQDLFQKGSSQPIRIAILRETEFGDKRRLINFATKNKKTTDWNSLGISGSWSLQPDHKFLISKIRFMSPAEKADFQPGDKITSIEQRVESPLPKEWIFIPALALLLLTGLWNRSRARISSAHA